MISDYLKGKYTIYDKDDVKSLKGLIEKIERRIVDSGLFPKTAKVDIQWSKLPGKERQGLFTVLRTDCGKAWRADKFIAIFHLQVLPGCDGIALSTRSEVYNMYQNMGIGRLLNRARIDLCRDWGYSLLMCTVNKNNKFEKKILDANKWVKAIEFNSSRNASEDHPNFVEMYTIELAKVEPNDE